MTWCNEPPSFVGVVADIRKLNAAIVKAKVEPPVANGTKAREEDQVI